MEPGPALRAALHLTDREHRARADGLAAFTDGEAHAGLERYTSNELEAHACVTAGLDARCADDGFDFACDVGGAKEELGLVADPKGRVPSSFFGGQDEQLGLTLKVRVHAARCHERLTSSAIPPKADPANRMTRALFARKGPKAPCSFDLGTSHSIATNSAQQETDVFASLRLGTIAMKGLHAGDNDEARRLLREPHDLNAAAFGQSAAYHATGHHRPAPLDRE